MRAQRTTGGAGTSSVTRVQRHHARREQAERASRELAVAVTSAVGVPRDDESAAQRFYDMRSGRKYVYGPLLWLVDDMERRGVEPRLVRSLGEIVASYCADVAEEMEQRTVRRATLRERASGIVAVIAPPTEDDPSPAAPGRRAA